VEKYGSAGKATGDSILRRMRFACCVTKAADAHFFLRLKVYVHARQFSVIRTLLVFFRTVVDAFRLH
jgi:hypothetical protein